MSSAESVPPAPPPRVRVLLIGIDAYRTRPLHGCVNDIDAVQRLLIHRVGVPAEDIRRLASPHPGRRQEATVPDQPATLENIRSELRRLAAEVQEGDRVFLYYSGHGARLPFVHSEGYTVYREALVPADAHATSPPRLLYNHEINEILAGIVQRTPAVTCVLDCCHSAGVTRAEGPNSPRERSLDPEELGWQPPPLSGDLDPAAARGEDPPRSPGACHVVSACLNFERAVETTGEDGVRHGLFTYAFLRALGRIPDPELAALPWTRIWQEVRAGVERRNPSQHAWMADNPKRMIFGGPPVASDLGLSLRRAGGEYEIDAGTLAAVTVDALIAVYGDQRRFPAPDSREDLAARRGLLRVTSATLGSARAVAEGPPFELSPGAQGRIVRPGQAARLRCAIVPPDEQIAARLEGSPVLELVGAQEAQVRLELVDDRWLLSDDVHEATADGALVALGPGEVAHVRELLEHYHRYVLPVRMAESARDLPGALQLEILSCEDAVAASAALEARLPPAPSRCAGAYELVNWARVCFRVRNASQVRLHVTLLNAAASGRVQLLGDTTIDADSAWTFWYEGRLGQPFAMHVPEGKRRGIDRFIAVGTTTAGKHVNHLSSDRRFADILGPTTRSAPKDIDVDQTPIERWTATQVLVTTRLPGAPQASP